MNLENSDPVLTKVVTTLREILYVRSQPLRSETRLVEDLGLDSLDLVTAFLDLEEDFGVQFPDDAPARLATVGDIAAALRN